MNIEFLAVIVGSGVAIVLVAVLAELVVLRSAVSKSAAAVEDLVADAHEHQTAAHTAASGAAGADSIYLDEPQAAAAPDVVPGVQQATAAAQLSLALPVVAQGADEIPSAQGPATNPPTVAQPLAKSEPLPAAPDRGMAKAVAEPVAVALGAAKPANAAGSKALAQEKPGPNRRLNGQRQKISRRPDETDEEFAARQTRWQRRQQGLQAAGGAGKAARPKAISRRPDETDEEFAARQERLLSRTKRKQPPEDTAE
jgi:hypothetical protein